MRGPVELLLRAFSGMLGLCAACVALIVPLQFLANTVKEAESAKQYGGHASLPGGTGAITLVLFVGGVFGVWAYILLRFSFYRRKRTTPDQGAQS